MTKFLNRIATIVVFCAIGWGLGYLYGIANLNGYLIQWKLIGKPPVSPTEILSINNGIWIKVTNREIYYYNDEVTCTKDCWTKVNSAPSILEDTLSLENCSSPSQKRNFITYRGKCESYGPGGFHVIYYGISADGTIYRWEDFSAEGDAIISLVAPFMGLFLGLILSVGIVIVLYVKDWINSVKQRQ